MISESVRGNYLDVFNSIDDNRDANIARRCLAWFRNRLCCCLAGSDVRRHLTENPGSRNDLDSAAIVRSAGKVENLFANPVYDDSLSMSRNFPDTSWDDFHSAAGTFQGKNWQWAEWQPCCKPLKTMEGYQWGDFFSADNDELALRKCLGFERVAEAMLGEGTSGTVYKFKNSAGSYFAVKIVGSEAPVQSGVNKLSCSSDVRDIKANRGEWVGLQLSDHPGIASVYALIMQDSVNTGRYMAANPVYDFSGDEYQNLRLKMVVSEYVEGTDLLKASDLPSVSTAPGTPAAVSFIMNILPDLLDALVFLQENAVLHRDLQCQNIMITLHGQVKIVDFGSAIKLVDRSRASSLCGTPLTIAPEMYEGLGCSYQAECWSLGVVLLDFLSNRAGSDLYRMVVNTYNYRFPDEAVSYDSETMNSSLTESGFVCTMLMRLDYQDISQLFDDAVGDGQHHPQTPVLKIIVTRMLMVDPAVRMTILEIRQLFGLLKKDEL